MQISVQEEIIFTYGSPKPIILDIARCFTAIALQKIMKQHGLSSKTVCIYASTSDGRGERMVSTIEQAAIESVLDDGDQ